MAGDLIRFVDSIAASPTVRLNVNDEVTWWVKSFSAPPPRLRRSMSSNAMRDGVHVSSSSYEPRTVTLELEVRTSTQDATATAMQTLWRELDRADNVLMYQPTGATKPVFFRLYRSDTSQLEDVHSQAAMRRISIDLLAEPFALGLKEALGPYTVNNDPAAASNGCFFDVTGVLGDVPALPLIRNTAAKRGQTIMGIRQHGTPANAPAAIQCETTGLLQDTANPGGGPDAVMSGAGVNNFVRTSFATTTPYVQRLSALLGTTSVDTLGRYAVYAVVRRSDSTSAITIGVSQTNIVPPSVTLPLTTSRILVRCDTIDLGSRDPIFPDGGLPLADPALAAYAGRSSGTGTLDWDCLFLVPADRAILHAKGDAGGTIASSENWFDSQSEAAYIVNDAADPTGLVVQSKPQLEVSGSFLTLAPSQTNRIWWLTMDASTVPVHAKAITDTVAISYHPRYLHVRPSAS